MFRIIITFFLIIFNTASLLANDYGVVKNGFPSWEERTVLVWTNRARSDPVEDLKGCNVCADKDCYKTPSRPLTYDYNLNRAARFHCANLISCGGFLKHDSPCTLVSNISNIYLPNGECDGSASCACVGGKCECNPACTSWSSRISMFGTSPSGENAAYGFSDPVQTFYQWFWEPESDSNCGFRSTNGHRVNILNNSHSSIGIGNYQNYWTQDFSTSSKYTRKLYSGTHYPKSGKNIEFRANWADSSGPLLARVIIDGIPFDMSLERGSPTNGTYLYKASIPQTCQRYYFLFKSSNGVIETFPDEGAYGVNCNQDYFEKRDFIDAGYIDTGIDTGKDTEYKEDINPFDAGIDTDYKVDIYSPTEDGYTSDLYLDTPFKRDSYPDYVNSEEGGCGCTIIE